MTERRSKYNARRTDEYAEAITINLPYPIVPYVRMTRRGKFTSEAAQKYLANQDNLKLFMRVDRMLPPRMPLAVDISVTVPQSVGHRCDLDNLLKAILDAGRGILYADDRWIDSIVIDRRIGKDWITKIHIRTEEA